MNGRFRGNLLLPPGALACARAILRYGAVLATFAAATMGPSSAWAQFKQNQPKLSDRDGQSIGRKLNSLVSNAGTAVTPEEKQIIDSYFTEYLFPTMSQYDPVSLGQLAKNREAMFRYYIDRAKSPTLRNYLIDLTVREMGKLSLDDYHPAVRYNAVLLIAGLDAEPGGRGAGAKLPVPLPKSTNALLYLLEKESINNVIIPSSVKVAALVGLRRHARLGIDPQFKDRLNAIATKIATSQEVPGDISDKVHAWIRCQAAAVLANANHASADPVAHQAIMGLVADQKLDLEDRCYAARLLTLMTYPGTGNIDAGTTVVQLGELAQAIAASEHEEATEVDKKLLQEAGFGGGFGGGMEMGMGRGEGGGYGGGYGGGGYGGMGGMGGGYGGGYGGGGYGGMGGMGGGFDTLATEEETKPTYEKRRMLQYVMSIVDAGKQIAPVLADADRQRMEQLVALLQKAADTTANRKAVEVEILKAVMGLKNEVNMLVNSWKPKAAPVEESPDDEFGVGG